jgi:hypothetical protein
MGLDVYFHARKHVSNQLRRHIHSEIDFSGDEYGVPLLSKHKLKSEDMVEITYVIGWFFNVTYIHEWFLKNGIPFHENKEERQDFILKRETLENLLNIARQVIEDNALAVELLPTRDKARATLESSLYNEKYFNSLNNLEEMLIHAIALIDHQYSIYYMYYDMHYTTN